MIKLYGQTVVLTCDNCGKEKQMINPKAAIKYWNYQNNATHTYCRNCGRYYTPDYEHVMEWDIASGYRFVVPASRNQKKVKKTGKMINKQYKSRHDPLPTEFR